MYALMKYASKASGVIDMTGNAFRATKPVGRRTVGQFKKPNTNTNGFSTKRVLNGVAFGGTAGAGLYAMEN